MDNKKLLFAVGVIGGVYILKKAFELTFQIGFLCGLNDTNNMLKKKYNRGRSYDAYREKCSYDEIVFENRPEAEEVLSNLIEALEKYSLVSVADYKDLVGIIPNYKENIFGWTNLTNACVIPITKRAPYSVFKQGYTIRLPKPVRLGDSFDEQ